MAFIAGSFKDFFKGTGLILDNPLKLSYSVLICIVSVELSNSCFCQQITLQVNCECILDPGCYVIVGIAFNHWNTKASASGERSSEVVSFVI